MADLTRSTCVTNGSAEIYYNAASSTSLSFAFVKDSRAAILIKNDGAATLSATVSKGTGISSVMGDLAVSIPAGEEYVVGPLESARFRNMSTGSGG